MWIDSLQRKPYEGNTMNPDELAKYAQENAERFWVDAGNHWLNDSLDLRADSQVIEVGGYLGNWTDYVQRKYDCFVSVYEPVKEFYEHMERRFSNRPKIDLFNFAVEAYTGQSRMAVMNEGSNLYYEGKAQGPLVNVIDAAAVIIGEVGLLALNCEGSEYVILDRLLETGKVKSIRKILVQFHSSFPNAEIRRDKIRQGLAKTHYETFSYPFCWERWERQ